MVLDISGRPIRSHGRIDGFQLPDGAIVSARITLDIHNRIKNNSVLREKLEQAQRFTGRKLIHLDLLRAGERGGIDKDKADYMIRDQAIAEDIMHERIDKEDLATSGKAYESSTI